MLTWKTKTKPTPDTDGQLHVDDLGKIWVWHTNNNNSQWEMRDDYQLKKVREHTLYLKKTLKVQVPPATLRKVSPGQLKNEWDLLYKKAFIAITLPSYPDQTSSSTHYLTGMTWAELQAWVYSHVQGAAEWAKNVDLSIYEVFKPGDSKVIAYNSMYSSARGGGNYNRNHNRGTQKSFGSEEGFEAGTYWTAAGQGTIAEPGRDCLNKLFPGLAAPSSLDSRKAIWFQVSRRNLYRHPKSGSYINIPGNNTRWAYNTTTHTYESIPAQYFVVGEPVLMYRRPDSDPTERKFLNMSELHSSEYFRNKMEGVLAFPLQSGVYRAVFVKPYGIDHIGIGHKVDTEWKVIAEYAYEKSERGFSHKVLAPTSIWDTWNECHRMNFHTEIGFPGSCANVGIDDRRIADTIQFYALHLPTGLRTDVFSSCLRTIRRQNHVTMCLVPGLTR